MNIQYANLDTWLINELFACFDWKAKKVNDLLVTYFSLDIININIKELYIN